MKNQKYISDFSLKLYRLFQRIPILRYFKVIFYFIDFFLLLPIKKPKPIEHTRKKIFIMYNFAFGDGLIWLCSAKHIRELYPTDEYEITLMCQKGLQSLYENEDIFDHVVPYDMVKATFSLKERYRLYKKLREEYYDIVLDPIGVAECTTNVFMSRALVAKEKYSILDVTIEKKMCPKWIVKRVYTKIIEVKESKLSLMQFYAEFLIGLGLNDFQVEFEPTVSVPIKIEIPKKFFVVFPSASTEMKRWPIERMAELTNRIYKRIGIPLLFVGTEHDRKSYNQLQELLDPEIELVDIIGKTGLLEFVEILKRATMIVTNDTSTYHIAAINEVPVALVVGGYTFDRYVKYEFPLQYKFRRPIYIVKEMDCFNCDNRCSKLKSSDEVWPCLDAVRADYAWDKVSHMIDDIKL